MNANPGITGILTLETEQFEDKRGSLSRLFDQTLWDKCDFDVTWRQAFVSRTDHRNTVRGLHYQFGDGAEAKMIAPLNGEFVWVCVDLREKSATFGNHVCYTMQPGLGEVIVIPAGFAHGCMSLTDAVEILILSNAEPAPELGGGIRWDDPQLGIKWPQLGNDVIISDDHDAYPGFDHFLETRGSL